jgi:hypothetical protein
LSAAALSIIFPEVKTRPILAFVLNVTTERIKVVKWNARLNHKNGDLSGQKLDKLQPSLTTVNKPTSHAFLVLITPEEHLHCLEDCKLRQQAMSGRTSLPRVSLCLACHTQGLGFLAELPGRPSKITAHAPLTNNNDTFFLPSLLGSSYYYPNFSIIRNRGRHIPFCTQD